MNNNSAQFSCCNNNAAAASYYNGYDWRFGRRVKNLRTRESKALQKSKSDADLIKSVKWIQRDTKEAPCFRQDGYEG